MQELSSCSHPQPLAANQLFPEKPVVRGRQSIQGQPESFLSLEGQQEDSGYLCLALALQPCHHRSGNLTREPSVAAQG